MKSGTVTITSSLEPQRKPTLQPDLVALQRVDRLVEQRLGINACAAPQTRHVNLLKLDGHIVLFEDCLDRFGDLSANTVTCPTSGLARDSTQRPTHQESE